MAGDAVRRGTDKYGVAAWMHLAFILPLLLLGACATQSVRVAPGDDDATLLIAERWKPRMERAMSAFEHRIQAATGKATQTKLEIVITKDSDQYEKLSKATAADPDVLVVHADSYWPSDNYRYPVGGAVVYRAVLHGLQVSNQNPYVPQWFRHGVAVRTAYSVIDSFADTHASSADFDADVEIDIRNKKLGQTSLKAIFELSSVGEAADQEVFSNLSSYAVRRLEQRMGPRFDAAWNAVLIAARSGSFDFAQAFETEFGISLMDFQAQVLTDLRLLHEEKRTHQTATPPANLALSADDLTGLPHKGESFVAGYQKYLLASPPKAFAYSRAGDWIFKNDVPNAMEWALRECSSISPLGCKLYAVDSAVVSQSPGPNAGIEVVMVSNGGDAWTAQVASRWLPVIKRSVDEFERVLKTRFDVRLTEATKLYVVSNRQDYQRLLRDKFGESSRSALIAAEATDGLANASGQLAAALFSTTKTEYLWETATLLTLHELVHEMQNQLAAGNAGFVVPRWIKEGSAEQISHLIARTMSLDPSAKFVIPEWRDICIEWYKLRGAYSTVPEDVMNKSFDEWLALSEAGKQPYKMSGLMLEFLQERLGERYYPALLRYLRIAAQPGTKEADAFQNSFALSQADFLIELKRWLKVL